MLSLTIKLVFLFSVKKRYGNPLVGVNLRVKISMCFNAICAYDIDLYTVFIIIYVLILYVFNIVYNVVKNQLVINVTNVFYIIFYTIFTLFSTLL